MLFRSSFSGDMFSHAVKRIEDVNMLRSAQFIEDGGPMSHPIRPESYVEINNFYTLTVYEKGSEVVRMYHTLLGAEGFRKGTDLYFDRHDGQAVTCEDFIKAMEDANGADLSQFKRWYSQAGTPEVSISTEYDAVASTYTVVFSQSCPPSPDEAEKLAYHIPVLMGLLNKQGDAMNLQMADQKLGVNTVLNFTQDEQVFVFTEVHEAPVPSFFRGFSAPVKISHEYSDESLAFLMAHDSDEFNRWDAGQRLAIRIIENRVKGTVNSATEKLHSDAFGQLLENTTLDANLVAEALRLPKESYLSEFFSPADPLAIHHSRRDIVKSLAATHKERLLSLYHRLVQQDYNIDSVSVGKRSLRNTCLAYLVALETQDVIDLAVAQFNAAENMTDVMAALAGLVNINCTERDEVLAQFYAKWKHDPLVVDKWLALQATSALPDTLNHVELLIEHEAFNIKNPNKVRSLIGAFCAANPVNFHQQDGAGYKFLADYVLALNELNPQIAARLLSPLIQWHRYDEARQAQMKLELKRILSANNLSKNVFEIASKGLA